MDTEKLKQAKKACGFTYNELSKRSGVPISTLYDVFRGVSAAPRIDTVQAIERALGISGEIALSKSTSQNVDEERLLKAFYRLVPTVRAYALEMIEKLADCQMHLQT